MPGVNAPTCNAWHLSRTSVYDVSSGNSEVSAYRQQQPHPTVIGHPPPPNPCPVAMTASIRAFLTFAISKTTESQERDEFRISIRKAGENVTPRHLTTIAMPFCPVAKVEKRPPNGQWREGLSNRCVQSGGMDRRLPELAFHDYGALFSKIAVTHQFEPKSSIKRLGSDR